MDLISGMSSSEDPGASDPGGDFGTRISREGVVMNGGACTVRFGKLNTRGVLPSKAIRLERALLHYSRSALKRAPLVTFDTKLWSFPAWG